MSKQDSNPIKDTMWAMFWKGNQVANLTELEESVKRLIRMATQKNAGQRKDSTCIDWNTLDMELMRIAIEATAFVLDDRFEELKNAWERQDRNPVWHDSTEIPATEHTREYLVKDSVGVISGRLYHPDRGWGKLGRMPKDEVVEWREL